MIYYTNHTLFLIHMQRVVTQPDILFDVSDLVGPPQSGAISYSAYAMGIPWDSANVPAGHGGPGTIDSTGGTNTTITLIRLPRYIARRRTNVLPGIRSWTRKRSNP